MPRALTGLVAVVALALAPAVARAAPLDEEAHLAYPAPAAAFRERVRDHEAKARARLEKHIADEKLDREKADALRARFQAAIAQIDAKVSEACADGTVTLDEARAVHALAEALKHPSNHPSPASV